MTERKALQGLEIDKENFESFFDEDFQISNEIWEEIADEIDGRTANFLDEILENIVQDIKEGKDERFASND